MKLLVILELMLILFLGVIVATQQMYLMAVGEFITAQVDLNRAQKGLNQSFADIDHALAEKVGK